MSFQLDLHLLYTALITSLEPDSGFSFQRVTLLSTRVDIVDLIRYLTIFRCDVGG